MVFKTLNTTVHLSILPGIVYIPSSFFLRLFLHDFHWYLEIYIKNGLHRNGLYTVSNSVVIESISICFRNAIERVWYIIIDNYLILKSCQVFVFFLYWFDICYHIKVYIGTIFDFSRRLEICHRINPFQDIEN